MAMLMSFLLALGMAVAAHSNNTDLAALLAFRSQLSDHLGILEGNWTTKASFCHWTGVSCSRRRQRVTALELPGVPLHGEITPHLGNLSFLRVLNLTGTYLLGSIPNDLGRLSRLVILDLGSNNLSGTIPSTIGNLTMIQALTLDHNYLSGKIPSDLLGLLNLRYLSLKTNYLSGPIPNFSSTSTPSFTHIYINKNSLSGFIPHGFGSLVWLRELWLRDNQLTGPAPPSIFNMSRLMTMALGRNNLSGSIPGNESFMLPSRIPVGLATCKNLQILDIPGNLFVDVIPRWLAQLPHLTGISMGYNKLFGHIPPVLRNITKLEVLDIPFSNLSGQIPEELGTLRQLTSMHLPSNQLACPFPSFIGNLSKLTYLNLEDNQLTGPVLSTLGNLRSIQTLRISSNNFGGDLDFLGSLGNCQQLQVLCTSNNPYSSATLNPNHVGNLSTKLLAVEAINSQIVGGLPATISNLNDLYFISLQYNQLNKAIPESLTMLENLELLALSTNSLSGPIPIKIGSIPNYLAKFSYLSSLNLAFNNREGRIPSGGVFSSLTFQSLMGNHRLCGGTPRLGFLPCAEKPHPTHGQHILKITLPIVTIAFGVIMVFLYLLGRKKIVKNIDDKVSVEVADVIRRRPVSYREIVHATNNFNQDNLLGAGNFGRVFKGHLDDGMVVAIKVLNMEIAKATESFDAECEALRMARHRNLIRIFSTCSNMDFRALLLQYMPNGNLEEHLHSNTRPCMGFLRRLGIMLDVSLAMEYLHHSHYTVVLHCDLKPSNVLFDEYMTAHVADFGIAKILLGDNTSIVSARMPGTIGYVAPEYAFIGKASRKSDVFSFGIMLLEVFTGKRPIDPLFVAELTLREWVSKAFPARLIDIADDKLLQDEETRLCFEYQTNTSLSPYSTVTGGNFLASIFELGLICSSEPPEQRMAMNDVVVRLKNINKEYCASIQALQRP
ncbi:Leucine Rich Repeat, putative [Panicum miliaceum]|uniref:non-specific serine/threonine protein kinase n=1 Tax=Panicum miliaceum TaxID=4540 RepID=A0A3L6T7W9_PANMI|nr:Leucine Rich Repeat, putative [Panicum miliaceum]